MAAKKAAKKNKGTVITVDQADWLEERVKDIIEVGIEPNFVTKEIAKHLGAPHVIAKLIVSRAYDVRDTVDYATDGEAERMHFEDVVNAYDRLDDILNTNFHVKGRKRYTFRVE